MLHLSMRELRSFFGRREHRALDLSRRQQRRPYQLGSQASEATGDLHVLP